jgi:3-hydroxyacyl-CoA dehydrogenase
MEKIMDSKIKSIAVLGAGTMGAGIAALAADKDCKVLLLDINEEAAQKGKDSMISERTPMLSDISKINNVEIGTFDKDFELIKNYDWICEVVVEKLDIKRQIFEKIEQYRKDGSIVSSNTSGIPLRDITDNMPDRLLSDVCITHFFNPVKVMKLCELIPGEKTLPEVINNLGSFLTNIMGKGVVNGKDTVNFIGNRIGCFLILKGLHEGSKARNLGLSQEEIDGLMSRPVGLPPTGLYGLIDLIGLDVMHSVGKNLAINLPKDDMGIPYVNLPNEEQNMFDSGQLGRKTGGGFYRIQKLENGDKKKEVFDLSKSIWRDAEKVSIEGDLNLILEESVKGNYVWNVMGSTLIYAASLVPEIADDIVNIDRAMRWGFAWSKGPYEMLDEIGPKKFINKCIEKNINIPKMLDILLESGNDSFYKDSSKYLTIDGNYTDILN